MRKAILTLTLSLAILSLTGCFGSSRRELADLVPASSFAVVSINWKVVNKDEKLKQIIKAAELENILRRLSVNSNDVTEMAVFSNIQNSSQGSSGLIFRGAYKSRQIIEGLRSQGWTEQSIDGHKVYSETAQEIWLASFESGIMVVGTRAGVEGAINAAFNSKMSFASTVAYNKLGPRRSKNEYPVSIICAFPQVYQDVASTALEVSSKIMDLVGIGLVGELLNKIGYARGLRCSISRSGNSYPMEMVVQMKDENAASFVSGSLNLLKSFANVAPGNNMSSPDMNEFQRMNITRDHEVLTISIVIPDRQLLRS